MGEKKGWRGAENGSGITPPTMAMERWEVAWKNKKILKKGQGEEWKGVWSCGSGGEWCWGREKRWKKKWGRPPTVCQQAQKRKRDKKKMLDLFWPGSKKNPKEKGK